MKLPEFSEAFPYYPMITGIHPAAELFPMPSEEEFEALVSDIRKAGLGHELMLSHDGKLVDGRSRLLACFVANQEIRWMTIPEQVDVWAVSWTHNFARRNLNTAQKALVANSLRAHYDAEARKRQTEGQERGRQAQAGHSEKVVPGNISTNQPEPPRQKAREQVAKLVGISDRSADKARTVEQFAPDIADKIRAGAAISLEEASREANRRKASLQSRPVEVPKVDARPVAPTIPKARIVKIDGTFIEINEPQKVSFNRTNSNVEWASWTWNPFTGCNHGCSFCYAREIATSERFGNAFPFKFEPVFHPYRLKAPANTPLPKSDDPRDGRVFVGSMTDVFGKWVPDDWIRSVFEACLTAPEWTYLFLSKWPARYAQMPLIPNAWYGSSIVKQSDVDRVTANMKAFDAPACVKWVSLEPLLEPIVFGDLSWCDLMVVGGQTSTSQPTGFVPEFAPDFDWVFDIVAQCREQGVPYYLKPNIGREAPGMKLPKMPPRMAAGVAL